MKKIAIDSYYYSSTDCYTVGVIFEDWKQGTPSEIISCHISKFGDYIPGEFYKRELPGILSLLQQINLEEYDTIILDSFLVLIEEGEIKPGLGAHLLENLEENSKITLIGVAKSQFGSNQEISVPVLRGKATNPLWVQGIGISNEDAAELIKNMAGKYRIPTLLKILDKETKKYG